MDTSTIPHPPRRLPILGDVIGANPQTPIQDGMRLTRELGPIFTRRVLGLELVFVSGADLVAELSDERRFRKKLLPAAIGLREIAGDGLFTADNDEPNWQLAHDILLPAFTAEAMRGYHDAMLDVARELLQRWDDAAGVKTVDVAADMTRLTLETIGRTGFGYSFGTFGSDRPHRVVEVMTNALRRAQVEVLSLPLVGRVLAGSRAKHEADIAWVNRFVDDVIEQRRQEGGGRDLAGLMLDAKHPKTGEKLDPVNVRYQVMTFIVAGHETTSGALSFALYYLSKHPDVLAAAQSEVDGLWGDGEPSPEYGDIAKLRYVRRVLDEALRLWPTVPAYGREATQEVLLGGKYRMAPGDWALVSTTMLHRDPNAWGPDPERFDPERFAPGQARQRPAHSYKPFGTGMRACIGRQFALHEAVMALGLLIHRYEFDQEPGYELKINEALTLKPDGFRLNLTRRTRCAAKARVSDVDRPADECRFPVVSVGRRVTGDDVAAALDDQ